MKLKKIFRGGWKRLPVRLTGVIILTFLPLNIISILVSEMVFLNSTRQIKDAYQRELNMGLSSFAVTMNEMENRYDNFVSEYQDELTMASVSDNMVCYDMLDSLKTVYRYTDFEGVFYICDRNTGQLYLKYNSDKYTVNEVEAMKEKLGKMGEISGARQEWKIERLSHYYFVGRVNKYTNFQIGFYVDIESELTRFLGDFASEEAELYIDADRQGLLKFTDGRLTRTEHTTWEEVFGNTLWDRNVFWSAPAGAPEIGVVIPGNRYFGGTQLLYVFLIALAVCGVALMAVMWRMLDRRVVSPLYQLNVAMQEIESDNHSYRLGAADKNETIEFRMMYEAFNRMADEIEASKEKDKKMYQAELDNLKLQVNPHMLLNSFNMIYSLAQTKNYECIQDYSMHLVEYFRYVLRENGSMVRLKKEMDFVNNYVEIQKIRFPDMFVFAYQVDGAAEEALVPPLLIQNFVENSMKYGLIPGERIEVLINIRVTEDKVLISVTDTGRGMAPEVLETVKSGGVYLDKMGKRHIGIANCRKRMEVFYGTDTVLHIVSRPDEGTQVWMEIPLVFEKEGHADGR